MKRNAITAENKRFPCAFRISRRVHTAYRGDSEGKCTALEMTCFLSSPSEARDIPSSRRGGVINIIVLHRCGPTQAGWQNTPNHQRLAIKTGLRSRARVATCASDCPHSPRNRATTCPDDATACQQCAQGAKDCATTQRECATGNRHCATTRPDCATTRPDCATTDPKCAQTVRHDARTGVDFFFVPTQCAMAVTKFEKDKNFYRKGAKERRR
uniref:Uncharacterized protein n=1 Tax=Candidatus Kentrum sp. MB TaxID=2138164 RepID=A0A451B914_9GAMM|nr:MAG: hypothetical protein BECKMB1821I_GA0114274_101012 [Candidatus Kentron sp. MB]VFK74786.1 MAG: hypothetical protein BECKMB1821H_GA0114242_101012 [Candidatus Kentron sp. MB]